MNELWMHTRSSSLIQASAAVVLAPGMIMSTKPSTPPSVVSFFKSFTLFREAAGMPTPSS